jgi:hypothetical protein
VVVVTRGRVVVVTRGAGVVVGGAVVVVGATVVVVGRTVVVVALGAVVVVSHGSHQGEVAAAARTGVGSGAGTVAARQPMPTVATSAAIPSPAIRRREKVVMAGPSARASQS